MLILLDGVDCSGKTTLANALEKKLHKRGIKVTRLAHKKPKKHPLVYFTEGLIDYVPGGEETIICDRLHLSNRIYGQLLDGEDLLGISGQRFMDEFLIKRGALLVHMTASPETIRERLNTRGDDILKPEHVDVVIRRYRYLVNNESTVPSITVTAETADVAGILAVAQQLEQVAVLDAC